MRRKLQRRAHKQVDWLPIDSGLIPPIFGFGHVKGIAKIFLSLEIVLAIMTVFGSLVLLLLRLY